MIGRTEVEHMNYQIEKAELRLSYQKVVVKKLGFDAEPRYADLANDLLAMMENRISLLHKRRDALLSAQTFERHATGGVHLYPFERQPSRGVQL